MLLSNTAEGGSNGTTVSSANSGGTSGTAWDSVTIGASASLIFDTTHPSHGSLGYRFATGASSVQSDVVWSTAIGTAVASCWFRLYVFTPSSFANTPSILRMQGSGSQAMRLTWDASGHVLIRNGANTTVGTSTTALSTSTAYRIEGFCTVGASGTAEIKIFTSVDSTTVTETLTEASQNYGTNNIDTFTLGQVAAATNIPNWWADDITINDSGYPGPAVVNPAPAEAAFTFAAGDPTVSTSSGASPTPAEGAWTVAAGAPTPAVGAVQQLVAAMSWAAGNATVTTSTAPGTPFLDQFIGGYGLTVSFGFGVDVTTAPAGWTLTDVSGDVLQPGDGSQTAVAITRGRLDEFSQAAPSTCTFTLINTSGNYTPRRRQGSHWPYMKIGLPVQVAITNTTTTYERFSGFVDALEPAWDETGNYAVVVVTAHGITQRLGQGSDPLRSALYRFLSNTGLGYPDVYWPMEDGANSTQAAQVRAGFPPLAASGTIGWGAAGPPGSAPLPEFSGKGTLAAQIAPSGPFWGVHFVLLPDASNNLSVPISWNTTSGTYYISTTAAGGGTLTLAFMSFDFTNPVSSTITPPGGFWDGLWHDLIVTGGNNSGQTHLTMYIDGVSAGSFDVAGVGATWAPIGSILVNSDKHTGVTATAWSFGLGHVALFTSDASLNAHLDKPTLSSAAQGYTGEGAVTRMTRLCTENSIAFVADSTSAALMGPQSATTLLTLLAECEAADGGVLEDGVGFGLSMHTVNGRYNTAVGFTPTLQQVDPPWRPVENNLRVRNDVTAYRTNGSFARYTQPAGLPYAAGGAGGVGTYSDGPTFNLSADADLIYHASFEVGLGTVDVDRYPAMGLNLAARSGLIPTWLPVGISGRFTVTGGYPTGASDPPDQIVEGWSEQLSRMLWRTQVNSSPARPWIVGVLDTDRLDTAGLTLHASWNGVAGTFTVDNGDGVLCSTSAGDYPQDLNVDGQRVTVSACTGSSNPQTMTVSVASVNGVSVTHSAGAAVSAWAPLLLAM